MPSADPRPLTDRQRDVIERIDRRVPIKVIAQEMGVSETRINQHIRALKDVYEAGSLNELVEKYRATKPKSTEPGSGESNSEPKPFIGPVQFPGQMGFPGAGEHKVSLGVFDGRYGVLARLAAVVGIAFGVLLAVILALTAAQALSDVMDVSV